MIISDQHKFKLIEVIKAVFKEEVLSITVIGSRAKNLFNSESDFDIRVIYKNIKKNYILQKIPAHHPIDTEIEVDNKKYKVEGKGIDIISAFNYAYKTNAFAAEILKGITIYLAEDFNVIALLKDAYTSCFTKVRAIDQVHGLLISEFKHCHKITKGRIDDLETYPSECKVKNLCEVNYLYLVLEYLYKYGVDWVKITTIDDLLVFAEKELTTYNEDFKSYFKSILDDRRQGVKVNKPNLNILKLILGRMNEIGISRNKDKEEVNHIEANKKETEIDDILYNYILVNK